MGGDVPETVPVPLPFSNGKAREAGSNQWSAGLGDLGDETRYQTEDGSVQ